MRQAQKVSVYLNNALRPTPREAELEGEQAVIVGSEELEGLLNVAEVHDRDLELGGLSERRDFAALGLDVDAEVGVRLDFEGALDASGFAGLGRTDVHDIGVRAGQAWVDRDMERIFPCDPLPDWERG